MSIRRLQAMAVVAGSLIVLACGGGTGGTNAAATPTFSPDGGTYATAQLVTISSATAGATLYYTTDGSAPTTSSTPYAGSVAVGASMTLKAIATAPGLSASSVATAVYTIEVPAATPTFSPGAGTYTSAQSVTISSATAGATIHYTTDGSAPTTSSATYAGPVSVGASMTLKAIAIAPGFLASGVGTAAYTIELPAATPTFSPDAGTYTAAQSVTISTATAGATIYYTTDGSAPTTSSATYTAPVAVGSSLTLKAIATAPGFSASGVGTAAYTINLPAATPTFSPGSGTYTSAQSVTISSATAGATIHYTTDGSAPTTSSTTYAGPVAVGASMTLKAIATAPGFSTSGIGTAAYTINLPAATPTFTPDGGTYTSAQSVTITSATSGATIYYTTDGSTPTTSSTTYTGPVSVGASMTLKAIATAPGFSSSGVGTAAYTINLPAATPTFSPGAGTYTSAQSVTITSATSGATIHYTTDGSTPTTSSTTYAGPVSVGATMTLKAIATAPGFSTSGVGTAAYTINLPAATPTFSPPAGTYTSAQSVTLSSATSGATIHYTTDGSTPTTSSTTYTGPVSVGATMTLKAIAIATGFSASGVGTAAYTINLPAATPTFSPGAGTYTSAQAVTISSATSGATIHYTTDGSTPTTSSTTYAGPVSVASSLTLKAIATAPGFSTSGVGTAAYTISPPAETPTFNPIAGTYTAAQSVTITSATAGATLYYTTDGSAPTTSSPTYTGPVPVPSSLTLKAIATAPGFSTSATGTAAYAIHPPAAAPTFSPPGGVRGVSVTLSTTSSGASIYYTTDGSAPTTSSTLYTGPIAVADGSADLTIKALASGGSWSASSISSATYIPRILISFPFTTPGCYPSGSGLGAGSESLFVNRSSDATYLDAGGVLHTCPPNNVRVGCDAGYSGKCGLLVEPAATQLYPTPSSPAGGRTVTFPAAPTGEHAYYQFWVEGDAGASQTLGLAGDGAWAPGLPCTATPASPCQFEVTTGGTATLSAVGGTGALLRAQLEAGEYRTSFIPSGARAADVVWFDNPLAGTENLVDFSGALTDGGFWPYDPSFLTVVGGATDSTGGTTAVLVTVPPLAGRSSTFSQANVPVVGGQQYTWSFEAKNNGGTGGSLSIFCDTTSQDIVPATPYIGELNGTSWTRVMTTFTTPANCTFINVYLLRDSGPDVDLYLARPQLEVGGAFTSYSPTQGYPIASDISGGTWCVQGTWTPEKGAPWSSAVRQTHYRVISTFENNTRDAFFLSYAWSGVLTWDVWGGDDISKRLVPPFSPFADGTTHTVAGSNASGAITLYEDGISVGTPDGGPNAGDPPSAWGSGVFDAQKKKLGLTPLAGDGASQPFGGFLQDLVITRTATCN